ncbi:MAG: glycoside hydrolase family 25 protein [Deltaproteobacteria bacterium]|nr:glycoside hydrolase family 25 protein [Deltaproteobacteria bacterium]
MRLARLGLGLVLLAVLGAVGWWWLGQESEPPLELPECQDGPTTPGIDVSYHQEKIDWRRVRRAGLRFAFIRISDGTTVEDPLFVRNWSGARAAGMLRGSYQYFRPDQSATAQADLVIAALREDPGELPPTIDVETTGGLKPAAIAAKIRVWVERVRTRLGIEPLVYTSPDFWREEVGTNIGPDQVRSVNPSEQPLWLAHYTTKCPTVPAPWTRWTFWQHSQTGRVPGIKGPVDLDVFAGTIDQLYALRPITPARTASD